MRHNDDAWLIDALKESVAPMKGASSSELDPVLADLEDARIVLVGEASHGTAEFYKTRAELTRRLIEERGFSAVAVEGDWPDCFRVNRWVRGDSADASATDALSGFKRFPAWMWRNTEVVSFLEWLRGWNEERPEAQRAGFYGLDLYSLHASMEAVIAYLDRMDPSAAQAARQRYACFEPHGQDPQSYGMNVTSGIFPDCETEVIQQLVALRNAAGKYVGSAPDNDEDYFDAEQNARTARNAELYYRTMFTGETSSWNLRDSHMADTLETLSRHLSRRGEPAKIVVWAHNSHVGDARATEMGREGELNLGELARQRYGPSCRLIGLTTHHGYVTASTDWGLEAERKRVRPSLHSSYEHLFHQVGQPGFYLSLDDLGEASAGLREERLHRAIGVVYRPETERRSHYFHVNIVEQFDGVIHIDETTALTPLERTSEWEVGEAPETFPSGM